MKSFIVVGVSTVIAMLGIFVLAYLLVVVLYTAECNNIASTTGRETRYELTGGCYIEVDGEWVPKKNWIVYSD